MQSAESGLLILSSHQPLQRRVLKIKRILSYSRDTKVSHKVVLAYFRKHYWLIANGFCPYCHNHYRNFGILSNHIMRSHTLEVAEDYFKLREKIKEGGGEMKVDCTKLRQAFEEAKILKNDPYDFTLAMTHFYLRNEGLETPTGYSVPSSELKELIKKNELLIHYILDEGKDFMEACEKVHGS